MKKIYWFIFIILVLDQALKCWIKTTFVLGQEIVIFNDWFKLLFVENNGIAFGLQLKGYWGKAILSIFRIIVISGLGLYLYSLSKKRNLQKGLMYSIALIFAGAMGNILDSVFYGVLFSESTPYQVATFLPAAGGYAPFLHGKVVDMFYFPLIEGTWPQWIPYFGGGQFLFFRPVFNIADAAISVGVFFLVVFQKSFFSNKY